MIKITNYMSRSPSSTTNAEIARLNVVTRVRTRDLTVVCEFNLSGLPLHLRQKKKKLILLMFKCRFMAMVGSTT